MNSSLSSWRSIASELSWLVNGTAWRVTIWPSLCFQARSDDSWVTQMPDELILASAAKHLTPADWERYLDTMPFEERRFVETFHLGRLGALQVLARCPALAREAAEAPALVAFLAHHRSLRGTSRFSWDEIAAVHERSGLFGVLEWLGLPATHETIKVLGAIADPDLPFRLLEPLRASLWEPRSRSVLSRAPLLDDRSLSRLCHAAAA